MKHCPQCSLTYDDSESFCSVDGSALPYLPAIRSAIIRCAESEDMDFVLRGKQGKTLTVSGDTIKIEKKGLLTGEREKTILIRNVTSVEVKCAAWLSPARQ